MKTKNLLFLSVLSIFFVNCKQKMSEVATFKPPVSFEKADERADTILKKMTIDEKIELIGGFNLFFVKGFEKYGIPQFYLSDATQGVHIRKELSNLMEKSTAFPCPLALTATWNPDLAYKYAESIGEECRISDVGVLLGPGMNIYRISENGRNFEYFGEDPFLAARMVERYVVGMQSTGTMATLKHFLCNNSDHRRRFSNSVVDERTIHEIYLPAFQAGVDAGAMAVMTSYNQVNGEFAGQSEYVINKLLRQDLGFKWLVMTDWWSVYNAEKVIKSGMDLEMPGHAIPQIPALAEIGDVYVRPNAKRLLNEGKVTEAEIDRMAKSIMRSFIAMGMYDRPVKDTSFIKNFPQHEEVALNTAREAIVLLRNEQNILPLKETVNKKILLTGDFIEKIARGGGSAEVEGFNNVTMAQALQEELKESLIVNQKPTDEAIKSADAIIVSVGTLDSEGWNRPFSLPDSTEANIMRIASLNSNVIVVVNSGGGIRMTNWNDKVKAILYGWYVGQNGNKALAEIIVGKTNPSGKLPISIEKKFEDSPGYPYLKAGEQLDKDWNGDMAWKTPIGDVVYKEGVFVGYRWYETKKIEPLYCFGFGLSYTSFEISDLEIAKNKLQSNGSLIVTCKVKNTGAVNGAEVVQLYVGDMEASVPRPVKELKGFKKVLIKAGEEQKLTFELHKKDLSFYDVNSNDWKAEPGTYKIHVGSASNKISQSVDVEL